ncbi:MAG: hypothetical protein WCK59_04255 [Candidatus Falkowbacteria bacterium]
MRKLQSSAPEYRKICQEFVFLIREALKKAPKKGDQNFYSHLANNYLVNSDLKIMRPLAKENWPVEFSWLSASPGLYWPVMTRSLYVRSIFDSPFIATPLYFGYAVVSGELKRTAFYVAELLFNQSQVVIDPLAYLNEVKPDYYLGCRVDKKDLEKYLRENVDPLESLASRRSFSRWELRHKASHHASFMDYDLGW